VTITAGQRFAVFLDTAPRESQKEVEEGAKPRGPFPTPFMKIIKALKMNLQIVQPLLTYCRQQALRSGMVAGSFLFESHSLIISFGGCKRQPFHVDTPSGIFQCLVAINDNSPGTLHVNFSDKQKVGSMKDFILRYKAKRGLEDYEIPEGFTASFAADNAAVDWCENLRKKYGSSLAYFLCDKKCLGPYLRNIPAMKRGAAVVLPGNVIHAGPECDKPRAVLFLTIRDPQKQPIPYDSNSQYRALSLWSVMMNQMWPRWDRRQRDFAMEMLKVMVRSDYYESDKQPGDQSLVTKTLRDFAKALLDPDPNKVKYLVCQYEACLLDNLKEK
jgi:hypothetical protein